jgi:hypothetical protein
MAAVIFGIPTAVAAFRVNPDALLTADPTMLPAFFAILKSGTADFTEERAFDAADFIPDTADDA